MKELVRLRMRPSRDRKSFRYMLDYVDHSGKRHQVSLGHADKHQAERQRQEKELELRVNVSAATVAKKVKHLKRVFQLAEDRGQLDRHPLRRLKPPKAPRRKIRVFTDQECHNLCGAARQYEGKGSSVKWELLIRMCLGTGMRRGELMNTTWRDIDFARMTVDVSPKKDGEDNWEWHIKDTERRMLPLTADLVKMLIEHQISQPEGCPYVFVPITQYERIQELRRVGRWNVEKGRSPLSNFCHHFNKIRQLAGIEIGTFHDLRRTCLSNWVTQGFSLHEVKELAGHAGIETTERFYLAIRKDVVDRARAASEASRKGHSVARLLRASYELGEIGKLPCVSSLQTKL